jgi:ketosteroid isomerase-like protein
VRARALSWLGTLLCALALPASAQAPVAPEGPSPAEVVDAFHDALKAGDRRKALEQLTVDVLIFEQGRQERSRTEYARNHLAEDIAFSSATTRTVSRRAVKVQANVAWVTALNRTRGTFKNRAVDFVSDETMVLVRVGGKWRIAHIHWSFDDKALH